MLLQLAAEINSPVERAAWQNERMTALPARRPTGAPQASGDPLFGGRTLLEHVDEFRTRVVRSLIAVGVGMVVAFFFIDRLFAFIFAPTRRMLPPGAALIYTQPGEAFGLYINIAIVAGAILASPIIFYQMWRLIAPVLYSAQKRFVIPFVLLTTTGAVAGAAFSHYVLFPYMIAFFGTFSSPDLSFMPQISNVFGLYIKMLLGMVAIFQMPTFAFFLAKMGLVTARLLWRNIKYAILIIFVIAAVLTPSADPWNQTIFAAPMIVLYLISIVIAWLVGPTSRTARDDS
jgi:sec-independent protein translocase protein TatC